MDRPFLIREKMQVIMVDRQRRKDASQNAREQRELAARHSKAQLGNPRRWRRAAHEDEER